MTQRNEVYLLETNFSWALRLQCGLLSNFLTTYFSLIWANSVYCLEIDSLLMSCNELESGLGGRVDELERMRDVHARYREKMSRHYQTTEMSETALATEQQVEQLNDQIHQLTAER